MWFWRFVDKSDGCWTWNGTRSEWGYGMFRDQRRMIPAHRWAWTIVQPHVSRIVRRVVWAHLDNHSEAVKPEALT